MIFFLIVALSLTLCFFFLIFFIPLHFVNVAVSLD